jgi:REP element-mobilizing transposase RayT
LYEIAANAWAYIPEQEHAKHAQLDEWVVMPNHVHGIIQLVSNPGAPVPDDEEIQKLLPGSLGAIVGNYKMLVAKRVKAMLKAAGTDMKAWQRGCWERIMRNERELKATREYIRNNPMRWEEDRENLDRLLDKMVYHDSP